MQQNAQILVHVDKTVVRITGLSVRGLNISQLEEILRERLVSLVRIIGVTGTSLEMDVYGLAEEDILRNEEGLIQAIATAEGITLSDLTQLSLAEKIREAPFDDLPPYLQSACKAERWVRE